MYIQQLACRKSKNDYEILVGKPEEKTRVGAPKCRLEGNIVT
jgi:hypothetical protein